MITGTEGIRFACPYCGLCCSASDTDYTILHEMPPCNRFIHTDAITIIKDATEKMTAMRLERRRRG